MQAPVIRRSTGSAGEVGSNSRMAKLASAATAAPAEISRRRSTRSGKLSNALSSVPMTNPACTLLVSSTSWNALSG